MTNETPLRLDEADSPTTPAGSTATLDGAGVTFDVRFPFVRETVDLGGPATVDGWRPGVRFELRDPPYGDESESMADGEGFMRLTVVSIHKPGRFPTRVFYTRQFTGPDGKTFGKGALRIKTLDAFRRIARAYQHPYRIALPQESTP